MDSTNVANKAGLNQAQRLKNQQTRTLQNNSLADKKQLGRDRFAEALSSHQYNEVQVERYEALRQAFREFVQSVKYNNHSYLAVWKSAQDLAYYLATEDPVFGLSAQSVQSHAQQLMIDADVRQIVLPESTTEVDQVLNDAIQNAIIR